MAVVRVQRRAACLLAVVRRRDLRMGVQVIAEGQVPRNRRVAGGVAVRLHAPPARQRIVERAVAPPGEPVLAVPPIAERLDAAADRVQRGEAGGDGDQVDHRLGGDARDRGRSDVVHPHDRHVRGDGEPLGFGRGQCGPARVVRDKGNFDRRRHRGSVAQNASSLKLAPASAAG